MNPSLPIRKVLLVPAVHLTGMVLTGLAYFNLSHVFSGSALRWLSAIPALAYGALVIFGAALAYYCIRRMGASISTSIPLCLSPLLLWMGKEALRIATVFETGPSLYYILNPLHVGILLGTLGQLGLVEMLKRHRDRGAGGDQPHITVRLVCLTLLPWILLVAMQLDRGVGSYFTFLSGYSRLFEGHSLEYR